MIQSTSGRIRIQKKNEQGETIQSTSGRVQLRKKGTDASAAKTTKETVADAISSRGTTLQSPDYKTMSQPTVKNESVADKGNLITIDLTAQRKKRQAADSRIAEIEQEQKRLADEAMLDETYIPEIVTPTEKRKKGTMSATELARKRQYAEREKQQLRLAQEKEHLNRTAMSTEAIDEAQSAQDYDAQQQRRQRLLQMDTGADAEDQAAQRDDLLEQQKFFQNEMDFWGPGGEKYEQAKEQYDQLQEQIDALPTWEDLEEAGRLQRREEIEQAVNHVGFDQMSRYQSTRTGETEPQTGTGYAGESGWGDLQYDVINRNQAAIAQARANAATTGGDLAGVDMSALQQMTDDEIAIYNYYYRLSRNTAQEYLELLMPELTQRQMTSELSWYQSYAKEHPAQSSAFSILTSPVRGIGYVGQAADYLADGTMDENARYNLISRAGDEIRGAVSEEIEKNVEGAWGKVGSFAYMTGMSMGDFLMAAGLSGGTSGIATAIMGTGAAAQATVEAKLRGLSDRQAFTLGTIAGAAEIITEQYSLEALLDKTSLDRSALGYLLKNVLSEGSEEGASSLINLFADILVSQDESEWKQAIREYEDAGDTKKEAFWKAAADQAEEIGLDMLGGALSGGVMAGAGIGLNSAAQNEAVQNRTRQMEQRVTDRIRQIQERTEQAYESRQQNRRPENAGQSAETETHAESAQTQQMTPTAEDLPAQQAAQQSAANEKTTQTQQEAAGAENETGNEVNREETENAAGESTAVEERGNGADEEGRNVSDGGQRRVSGERTGEQAGAVAGRTGKARRADNALRRQHQRADQIRNRAESVSLERVSSRSLGLENGTDEARVRVLPEGMWDEELQRVARNVKERTGKDVTYVVGAIPIRKRNGKTGTARGVWTEDGRIIVQADNWNIEASRIAAHEVFHAMQPGRTLLRQIEQRIRSEYDAAAFDRTVQTYMEKLEGIIDITEEMSEEAQQQAMDDILEEIFADAYAGINAFSAHAEQYREAVTQQVTEQYANSRSQTSEATDRTTGPPTQQQTTQQTDTARTREELERVDAMMRQNLKDGLITQEEYDAIHHEIMQQPEMQDGQQSSGAAAGEKFSMSEEDRRDVIADLRQYLSGDMSRNELNRRIGGRETGNRNGRSSTPALSREAQNIKKAAARQGISVEEYLRQNWELFDVDGQWNQAAREALDSERGGRRNTERYSIDNTRDMEWEDQVEGYFRNNGTIRSSDSLYLGISDVTGVQNSPLYVPISVINKATRSKRGSRSAHEMEKGNILKLKKGIENAPAVIYNPERNAIVYVTENKDPRKNYIIASFDLNNDLHGENAHRATSIHGQENLDAMFKNLGSDAKIYVKNETRLNQMLPGNQILKSLELLASVELGKDIVREHGEKVKKIFSEGKDAAVKEMQFQVIQQANHAPDAYHTWIRSADEIRTLAETLTDPEWDYETFHPDYTRAQAEQAVERGTIRIYSSNPIEAGAFVTPSRMEAQSILSGNGKVYSKVVNVEDVAWIDPTQGQFAPTSQVQGNRFSLNEEEQTETGAQPEGQARSEGTAAQETDGQSGQARGKKKKTWEPDTTILSKRTLLRNLNELFSIPEENRAEMKRVIYQVADQMLKNRKLTQKHVNTLINSLYENGVLNAQLEKEMTPEFRELLKGEIYVPEMIRQELGDKWNTLRKEAYRYGIYLTKNERNPGIFEWRDRLKAYAPGLLYTEDETDGKKILRDILGIAEASHDAKGSIPEYAAWVTERKVANEGELIRALEQRVKQELERFAETARIENKVREIKRKAVRSVWDTVNWKESMQRVKRQERVKKQREQKQLREMQNRTLKQLQWLKKNQFRAPEELKSTWDEVLSDIDLYAVSAARETQYSKKYDASWKNLAEMYQEAKKNDPNFMPSAELERIVSRVNGSKLEDMDLDAITDLYKAAVGLRTEFYNRNNVLNDERHRLFQEVYSDSVEEIAAAPVKGKGGAADRLLNLEQLSPMNVMERMAGWNPDSSFYSMAKQLEQGETDMEAYEVEAKRQLEEFTREHQKWLQTADGQGKDAVWYELEVPELMELKMGDKPIFGKTVKVYMTPAQKVHMYLESRNTQNLRHMLGGRTFADRELYSQGKRKEAFAKGTTIRMAPETVKAIVSDLTAEEKALADVLDRYYNQFATEKINRVSNVLNGYDKAMSGTYAPIYTNENYTKQEFGKFDATAEGVGNLKNRIPYATNPSYQVSALEAFERNVQQTARYVGMAIPIRNWTTLMGWQSNGSSFTDEITHKWGQQTKDYLSELLTSLQAGNHENQDVAQTFVNKVQSNYISAVFGANPSIVLKQLGSIPLAGVYLDMRNVPTPAQMMKVDRDLISRYTQKLAWRTLGYSTPETKFLADNPNWTETNRFTRFVFGGGAITAMDGWAAGVLWPWAENRVKREHPELEIGTQAQIDAGESPFYMEVAREFENAVNRSQSTSDQIHQSTLRKSKSVPARALTLFKSDSAQTYNALRQAIGEAMYYKRSGADAPTQKQANVKIGTVVMTSVGGYAWASMISFLMAMIKNRGRYYRDDEGELTAESIAKECVSDLISSLAGVVAGGEELAEIIGNIISDDAQWWGLSTPGMEQLSDLVEAAIEEGGNVKKLVNGAFEVAEEGGSVADYFRRNSGEILGSMKEIATTAGTYLTGLPVKNVEAYMAGTLGWISPELYQRYESVFENDRKSQLDGLSGKALQAKVDAVLDERGVNAEREDVNVIAYLYEEGYQKAVPGNTPTSISIDGEEYALNTWQQQEYERVWGQTVNSILPELMDTMQFGTADDSAREKMLDRLYQYAAGRAKENLFENYEMDSWVDAVTDAGQQGIQTGQAIAFYQSVQQIKNSEELTGTRRAQAIRQLITNTGNSDSQRMGYAALAYGEDSTTTEQMHTLISSGIKWSELTQVYDRYEELKSADMKTSQKAVEMAYWMDQTGLSEEQQLILADELGLWNAQATRYAKLKNSGVDSETALDLCTVINALEPEGEKKSVSNQQIYKAIADRNVTDEDTLKAFGALMGEKEYQRVETAASLALSPKIYAQVKYFMKDYDQNGNGSYSADEVETAIDAYDEAFPGQLDNGDKAVLWQALTASTSKKNNPYSRTVAQRYLEQLGE